jgi:4-hydroxybenzoate polyprenyltransferase
VNDLADLPNDQARGMKTIPVLFGNDGCTAWITLFSLVHAGTTIFFFFPLGNLTKIGFAAGFLLVAVANLRIMKQRTPESALGALPLFHGSLILYAGTLVVGAVL